MKLNRKLVLILSLVLSLALATGGTLAYLQDTDADVNVMTLGSVYIVQNEQERDADDNLVEFTNNKPMLPAVGTIAWDDEMLTIGEGEYKVFADELANVVDKIVTVTNTGKSDAYVRTIIAFEAPEGFDDALLHINYNGTDVVMDNEWAYVEIDGARYVVTSFTYREVLAAGETSAPSLIQVFLDSKATNEDIEVLGDTYEILVLSQAVQTAGFDNAAAALNTAFGEANGENYAVWFKGLYVDGVVNEDMVGSPGDKNPDNNPPLEYTGDPAELAKLLAEASDAGSGDVTITLTENYDMTGYDWDPISVDGYNGAGVVTIEGNGHTIKGLNAPLYAGGFAGKSGIVIKDLTIADSDVVSNHTTGAGIFIENADSMQVITLTNCHVLNCTLSTTEESRAGALIGWVSGYSKQNDGPVKTYVTIENCSVVNTKISTFGSVGGIIGHAGASDYTYVTISDCTVTGCELTSTDDGSWRVGVAVGTANNGHVTISTITESDNTLAQTGKTAPEGQSNLYGRFVPAGTGTLVIDGVEIE